MKTAIVRSVLLAVVMLVGGSAVLRAAEPLKEDAAFATKLITAIEKSDYEAFVAEGEVPFKQLKQEQFSAVAAPLAAKLTLGYDLSFLGELKQRGYRVTLWKISFRSGGDDALATLSVKDGKVGGFWIR